MRRIWIVLVMTTLLAAPAMAADWVYNYDHAVRVARDQKRTVLINFTGSDWCGYCIKLKKEIFDTADFKDFANDELVLLEVDFPEKKRQDPIDARVNKALAQKFNVTGFPTLFLVDGQGKVLGEVDYNGGGTTAFLKALNRVLKPSSGAPPAPGLTPRPGNTVVDGPNGEMLIYGKGAAGSAPAPAAAAPPARLTPAPKVVYDTLILKGITGSANRPMALVNNKTFAPGDSYKVQVGTATLKVTCVSIAADHVIVQVEGEKEPRKLSIGVK
jgi:protein disulfide-isomerase